MLTAKQIKAAASHMKVVNSLPKVTPRNCCNNCKRLKRFECQDPEGVMFGKTIISPGTGRNCPQFKVHNIPNVHIIPA